MAARNFESGPPLFTIRGLQPLAILFGAGFTVLSGWAFGAVLFRDSVPDLAIRFVTGSALLSLLVFALCSVGLAYPSVLLVTGMGALALAGRPKFVRPRYSPWLLPFAPFFILYLFNSMAPEISYDGSRYHLGLVGRYLREHGFHIITDNMYAGLPQGVEMLYLFAYAFGRHSAAAMVHFGFLVALAWQVYSYARRQGWHAGGIAAALLVFASPLVGADGASAYVDVAVAAIAFTLFHLLQYPLNRRVLIGIGVLAGFAFAAKYTAVLAIPYAIGLVLWKSRRLRDAALVCFCAGILILPWLLRNYYWFHNPVAPFFNQYFPNELVTPLFEREYRYKLAHEPAGHALTDFGPVFLLAPAGLLVLRGRQGRQLTLAAVCFGLPYLANASTRFLIPTLPFIALAMITTLASFPRLAIGIALVHAVISWPTVLKRYSPPDSWHLVKVPYREALRIKPEDGFLESNLPLYGATRMVERLTPPHATVFTLTPIPEAYTSRNIRVAYQSTRNIMSRNVFWIGFVPEHMPSWRLRFMFPRQELGSFRIVQTASGKDVWSIHEVRIFDGERELPRSGWRSRSAGILDGSPVTFWMASDTLHSGEFVQVDAAQPVTADAVVIEAAPDQPGIQLRLDGPDSTGQWRTLAPAPVPDVAVLPDLRRAAAEELKRRGNDYLLLFDGEFGADDVRRNVAAWGVRDVGEYKGARLYQLP
jgi:hypothetical protein